MAKKGTFPANAMRRGEIYWVDIPNAIGHELMKDRPAIIVSCDALNDNSPVVQVVYCSASPKKELPEHITIRSTEQISTALCENVYTVDKVMRLPETFTDSGEDKRSLRRPVVGRVVYIHPKGHYHTVEFELNGGHVRESFKGVSD